MEGGRDKGQGVGNGEGRKERGRKGRREGGLGEVKVEGQGGAGAGRGKHLVAQGMRAGQGSEGQGTPGVACSRGHRHCTQGPHWHFSATVLWWWSGSLCTGYLHVC